MATTIYFLSSNRGCWTCCVGNGSAAACRRCVTGWNAFRAKNRTWPR
ncbi:hypothetical protein JOS77_30955 [Chromobacterium haemolyticum]|nr:hypothetical protein JOS77_30955 [Chromobacterium haemolyticum]